jgi:hypothetical protein
VLEALFPQVVLVCCQATLQQPLAPLRTWVKLVIQVIIIAACHSSPTHLSTALADADPLGVNTNVTFDEVGGLDERSCPVIVIATLLTFCQ